MHPDEAALLAAAVDDPAALTVLADWLDDRHDPRGEALRLLWELTRSPDVPDRPAKEERLRELVLAGTAPPLPRLVNSLDMELVLLPPGTFRMGTAVEELGAVPLFGWEHPVTLTRPFYLGTTAVTQGVYTLVMGSNPSFLTGRRTDGLRADRLPVESVSWEAAAAFCARLSALPGEVTAGRYYRLPTEAEWEYACRAGTQSPFWFGDRPTEALVNHDEPGTRRSGVRSRGRPIEIGSRPANPFGLYEMHGNVWEWCADLFGPYPDRPISDPGGATAGTEYVVRGGSWCADGRECRSDARGRLEPSLTDDDLGFRVALEVRRLE